VVVGAGALVVAGAAAELAGGAVVVPPPHEVTIIDRQTNRTSKGIRKLFIPTSIFFYYLAVKRNFNCS
jgi:hypothetical protein